MTAVAPEIVTVKTAAVVVMSSVQKSSKLPNFAFAANLTALLS